MGVLVFMACLIQCLGRQYAALQACGKKADAIYGLTPWLATHSILRNPTSRLYRNRKSLFKVGTMQGVCEHLISVRRLLRCRVNTCK